LKNQKGENGWAQAHVHPAVDWVLMRQIQYYMGGGEKMSQVEIYFNDLTPEAKKKVMDAMGITDEKEGNFEVAPLAILDYEQESTTEK
jgi:hypothetical protein